MSEIKALGKLREYADDVCSKRDQRELRQYIDELEAEVNDNHMRLPVDADGVPIRVGDSVNMEDSDKEFTVQLVGDTCFRGQLLGTGAMETHYSRCCLHVKPRTLEDVLEDYADEYYRLVRDGQGGMVASKTRGAAAEIRELLGGDGDE